MIVQAMVTAPALPAPWPRDNKGTDGFREHASHMVRKKIWYDTLALSGTKGHRKAIGTRVCFARQHSVQTG